MCPRQHSLPLLQPLVNTPTFGVKLHTTALISRNSYNGLSHRTPHVYKPFSSKTEIRIAIIQPAMEHDAPIYFEFHSACLKDLEGGYEAISYVWGAPILEFPVYHTTDGSRLLITENLGRALRRLRHRLDPQWLWADAICIDQNNNTEKSVQIPLMVDIFRGAKRVLAWLQHGDEAIERGMQCIERISRHPEILNPRTEGDGEDSSESDSDHDSDDKYNYEITVLRFDLSGITDQAADQRAMIETQTSEDEIAESDLNDSEVVDLLSLLNLSYFRRLWM